MLRYVGNATALLNCGTSEWKCDGGWNGWELWWVWYWKNYWMQELHSIQIKSVGLFACSLLRNNLKRAVEILIWNVEFLHIKLVFGLENDKVNFLNVCWKFTKTESYFTTVYADFSNWQEEYPEIYEWNQTGTRNFWSPCVKNVLFVQGNLLGNWEWFWISVRSLRNILKIWVWFKIENFVHLCDVFRWNRLVSTLFLVGYVMNILGMLLVVSIREHGGHHSQVLLSLGLNETICLKCFFVIFRAKI